MQEQKRGKNVSLVGLILQLILSAVLLALWRWSGSQALLSGTLAMAGGVLLWIVLSVLFSARQLAAIEQREIDQLETQADQGRIFEDADRLASRPAAARAEMIGKWVLPIFTFLLAGYYIGIGWWTMNLIGPTDALSALAPCIVILLLMSFMTFLFARYCLGMGEVDVWRPLRAAGSLLFTFTLFQILIAIALFVTLRGYRTLGREGMTLDALAGYIIPMAMFVFAGEILVNLILDIYRPRMPGQTPHPPFDSRLLNLLAQPSKVGHSLAETLNYQFGFEVSRTWFYLLVSRAFLPLVVFAMILMALMSSLVIVHPDQNAVVMTLGKLDPSAEPMGPGLNFKWPWPIQTVHFFPTREIKQLILGAHDEAYVAPPARSPEGQRNVILWQQAHRGEEPVLVAMPPRRDAPQTGQARGAGLASIVFVIRYRIDDIYTYGFEFENPDKLLYDLAKEEMIRLAASSTLSEEAGSMAQDPKYSGVRSVMTFGRKEIAPLLEKNLLDAIERNFGQDGLGVEILEVSLAAAHPPGSEIDTGNDDPNEIRTPAAAFEDVINARLGRAMQSRQAEAEANEILASVAGDPAVASLLALAIQSQQQLTELSRYLSAEPKRTGQMLRTLGRVGQDDQSNTGYIGAAGEEVARYSEQVQQERLVGKINPSLLRDESLGSQQLLEAEANRSLIMLRAWQEHLEMLRSIRAEAGDGEFDFQPLLDRTDRRINDLLEAVSGEPTRLIAEARAQRRRTELAGRTRAEAFAGKLAAYRASPSMYRLDRILDLLERKLPEIPSKVAVGIDIDRLEIRHDRTGKGNPLGAIPWQTGQNQPLDEQE